MDNIGDTSIIADTYRGVRNLEKMEDSNNQTLKDIAAKLDYNNRLLQAQITLAMANRPGYDEQDRQWCYDATSAMLKPFGIKFPVPGQRDSEADTLFIDDTNTLAKPFRP